MTPDFMPVLSSGSHDNPREGACIMEYVSLLAGEPWSDHPACTHPVLAAMARAVNDRIPSADRHLLIPIIGRLFGTAPTGTSLDRSILSMRLAVWCIKHNPDMHVTDDSIAHDEQVIEAWCDAYNETADLVLACGAIRARSIDTAKGREAYSISVCVKTARYVFAGHGNQSKQLVALLTGLVDEYDRLIGRTDALVLTSAHLMFLAAAVG